MVKVKIHRLGRWFQTLYQEMSDELTQWATKHDLDPAVVELQSDSIFNHAWINEKVPASGRVLNLDWWLIEPILEVRIQVYGDKWADSAVQFAHNLELRIPPMLPKGFKMREIEVELKPPKPEPKSFHRLPYIAKVAVLVPNFKIIQQVFGNKFGISPSQWYFETLGTAFTVKDAIVGDEVVKLQLWFINQKPHFRSLLRMSLRASSAGIFPYELTEKKSFLKALTLVDEFDRFAGKNLYRVLLGYADDVASRWYPSDEILELLLRKGRLTHFELDLSMEEEKRQEVIDAIYHTAAEEVIRRYQKRKEDS